MTEADEIEIKSSKTININASGEMKLKGKTIDPNQLGLIMGKPAAKKGDQISGICVHTVMVPSSTGSIPQQLPHFFTGIIDGNLSSDVRIMGQPAAMEGSTATNKPSHVPTPPGTSFQKSPDNKATIDKGSSTVRINGKPAARAYDTAKTCSEVNDKGMIIAFGTVRIGD